MVGAIVTFAVLDGMSGAADTGERNRQRSVASTLAQQDIERLRAFEITDLSNYRETRNVNMGGVSYTVVSQTDWVRDTSGLISCTNDDTQAEYLKLTSVAYSTASEETPVREVSLRPRPGPSAPPPARPPSSSRTATEIRTQAWASRSTARATSRIRPTTSAARSSA